MRDRDESWRNTAPTVEEAEDDTEVKKEVNNVQVTEDMQTILTIVEERILSWHRMTRVVT